MKMVRVILISPLSLLVFAKFIFWSLLKSNLLRNFKGSRKSENVICSNEIDADTFYMGNSFLT